MIGFRARAAVALFLAFGGVTAMTQPRTPPPSEIPPRERSSSPSTELPSEVVFSGLKPWRAPRWYLVGRWLSSAEIQWVGGGRTRFDFGSEACGNIEGFGSLERAHRSGAPELLRSGHWVAVEISPSDAAETLVARIPGGPSACRAETTLALAWQGESGGLKPLLFLRPEGNRYFGSTFSIRPEVSPERADIQLELLLGGSRGSFPNADVASGAKTSFFLAPVAVARGEWLLPFYKKVGLTLALEQTVANFGAAQSQNVFLSDWSAGAFYQHVFPVLDGVQVRGTVRYFHHVADDNRETRSLSDAGLETRNLTLGFTTNFYFARCWLIGSDFDYGLPGNLAGRGRSSVMDINGRLGVRATGFLYVVGEFGYRKYAFEGVEPEGILRALGGIRLDL